MQQIEVDTETTEVIAMATHEGEIGPVVQWIGGI